ncbi:MAG: helix-turn-helix transcriptional regulator [Clostridia bacterium]|nr:helix-turn-helix transcriptional regulator [Clostridia bacterium]
MEDVKKIVSQNLVRLRKESNLTQAELAKRINYSDKAISRWEKGEVVPDLETIYALSEAFGVPVGAITEKQQETERTEEQTPVIRQRILSQIFLLCEIWFVICVIYVYINITKHTSIWQLFVWSVPASAIVLWFTTRREKVDVLLFIYASVFVWSFITCVYLHLMASRPWYLFFAGLPLQGLLVIRYIFNYKQNLKRIRIRHEKNEPQPEEPAEAEEK